MVFSLEDKKAFLWNVNTEEGNLRTYVRVSAKKKGTAANSGSPAALRAHFVPRGARPCSALIWGWFSRAAAAHFAPLRSAKRQVAAGRYTPCFLGSWPAHRARAGGKGRGDILLRGEIVFAVAMRFSRRIGLILCYYGTLLSLKKKTKLKWKRVELHRLMLS